MKAIGSPFSPQLTDWCTQVVYVPFPRRLDATRKRERTSNSRRLLKSVSLLIFGRGTHGSLPRKSSICSAPPDAPHLACYRTATRPEYGICQHMSPIFCSATPHGATEVPRHLKDPVRIRRLRAVYRFAHGHVNASGVHGTAVECGERGWVPNLMAKPEMMMRIARRRGYGQRRSQW
jgi:hypothetical protein